MDQNSKIRKPGAAPVRLRDASQTKSALRGSASLLAIAERIESCASAYRKQLGGDLDAGPLPDVCRGYELGRGTDENEGVGCIRVDTKGL